MKELKKGERIYDLSKMNIAEIRKFMADNGWYSKDSLTNFGWGNKFGYTIWFYRWNWHGKNTATICGDNVSFYEGTENLLEMTEAVKECAKRALKAYDDFPTSIPYQNSKGEIVELTDSPYSWEEGLPIKNKKEEF